MKGRLIAFEGPDGSGKSTQMKLCANRLRELGADVLTVREPGGTATGERIRDILLSNSSVLDVRAELFLFMACRAQLCADVIQPALAQGRIVLTDRFLWSSAAYQGGGLELGIDHVLTIGEFATSGTVPDLYVVVDVPPEVGLKRRSEHLDRIEARSAEFFEKLRKAYKILLEKSSGKAILIDGTATVEEVFANVWREVSNVLELD